ncbi:MULTISPECIES: beta-phosphoglucomutase [Clostridium]|uniref:Beta-phosphoglucomutase n=1 Tax=Clostridium frigoriphilum TaxID=443253 RepID=A0ABU7UP51_9CLOT|nr:beta-phosphoglucomutase [Clostridium sp. DSM 17811]MBU3099484.1 beta-phosphoglucomutase [Clostridium sp. DSM 17811]
MSIKAVIFDLDGVIVSTDKYHYQAWKKMADEEEIYFDKIINEGLRGVSRMESLEIILKKSQKIYNQNEKEELAGRKNNYYREMLNCLTPTDILPGVIKVLEFLRERGIKIAIGSSSKNTPFILEKIGLGSYFDAVSDGNDINKSKPDPEVFLLAAKKIRVIPGECLVLEDADAGIEAALAGGMKVMGVGFAAKNVKANYRAHDLLNFKFDELLK